jgi:hypothetical protein
LIFFIKTEYDYRQYLEENLTKFFHLENYGVGNIAKFDFLDGTKEAYIEEAVKYWKQKKGIKNG